MAHFISDLSCILVVIVALVLAVVGLPGTLLIVAEGAVYGFATGFKAFSPWFVLALLAVSLFAETAENLIGIYCAKRCGSSPRGIVASVVGAIIGGIVGAAGASIFGALIGALLGSFLGAYLIEYHRLGEHSRAAKAGGGAIAGRLAGMALKLMIGVFMGAALLWRVL